jgi:hypothetical protein
MIDTSLIRNFSIIARTKLARASERKIKPNFVFATSCDHEWIDHNQLTKSVPVLEVFSEQGGAALFHGGGDDQRVVEGEHVLAGQGQSRRIGRNRQGSYFRKLRLQAGYDRFNHRPTAAKIYSEFSGGYAF